MINKLNPHQVSVNSFDITLAILCGGQASRMLGINKPLWPITHNSTQRAMVDHIIAAANIDRVLISANQSLSQYAQRGSVITDAELGLNGAGPLMGVLAGLRYAQTPWLLICPGDTPFLEFGWHQGLVESIGRAPHVDAAVIHDGVRRQPLHALLRVQLESSLTDYLARGERSALGWLDTLHTADISVNAPGQFRSVNRFDDLL
ncbi:MAG: molybdenum cofactor guanylyltransferase [Candidatus Azotimanducaceae bacterium]